MPLGEVDFMMVNRLATDIGPVFNRSVDILKGMKIPVEAHNVIRGQYYANVVWPSSNGSKPAPAKK